MEKKPKYKETENTEKRETETREENTRAKPHLVIHLPFLSHSIKEISFSRTLGVASESQPVFLDTSDGLIWN